ncbi:MAG: helicase HerA-like domain-containing protein [Xanthobacteraceae bacterium]
MQQENSSSSVPAADIKGDLASGISEPGEPEGLHPQARRKSISTFSRMSSTIFWDVLANGHPVRATVSW